MIVVSHLRDWTRPEKVERRFVIWGIGSTARNLAPPWAEPNDPLVGCSRNGFIVTDWDALLADGDHLHFWARPGFNDIGLLASAAAFLFAPFGGLLFWFGAFGLVSRLVQSNKKPVEPDDQTSTSYAFSPLSRNARGPGVAIPRVYGRHRVAPVVINEQVRSFIDGAGEAKSEYLGLFLISSGPIHAIGDKTEDGGAFTDLTISETLEINGQPARNFAGVEVHVRLGNLDQTAIAEFADPVLSFPVELTMRDSDTLTHATTANDAPSSTTAIATSGGGIVGDPAGVNVTKWDAEEVYTAEDEADEFTAVLFFPQGLISYTSGGAAQANSVIYQIRYREVDGTGTPFGDYVILPAEQRTLTRGTALRLESRHKFYLPASYAAPVTGKYLESRAAGVTNPGIYTTVAGFTPAGPSALQFSFSTWVKRRNAMTVGQTARLLQWFDTPGNEGFQLNITHVSVASATLQFQYGTGTETTSPAHTSGFYTALTTDTASFHQLVVTYEGNYDSNGNSRVRFYLDSVLRFTDVRAKVATLDAAQTIRLTSNSHTAPTLGYDGHLDETTLWSRALTAYDIAVMFNGGAPQAVDEAATGLIIGSRFDSGTGVSPNLAAVPFGPYVGATNWILGSGTNAGTDPTISSIAGIVKTPATGTLHRGRFQIEVMRLDAEDTLLTARSEMQFDQVQLRTFEQYEYPGMALLAIKVPATDQISGGAPVVTERVDGALVPVWDGVDAVYPNMVPTYSRNPAWITADVLTEELSGLGAVYRAGDLDLPQFNALATFCDVRIYDNLGRVAFSTAAYRDSAAEAVTFSGVNLGEDVVRYRTLTLPSNFPQVTSETAATATGRYIKPILTGLTPAAPAWLTTQAGLAAQEVVFVEYEAGFFYIYTRTTQALGAGQTVFTVSGGSTALNGIEHHDVRARFDGVFDRQDYPAWDAVVQVLQTARAAPIRIGSRVSVFIDDVAQPVALVTMASIVQGSWKQGFMGVGDRPNAESVEIFDELLDYERIPVADEHPDVTTGEGFRWRRIRLEGITRKGQAKRFLRRDLNTFKLVRRWCEFSLGIDGLPLMPGDIIAVSHDVPQYGFSGRIYADSTNTTVKLDREVTIAPATGYQVQVEDVASNTRYTVTVTHAAGTHAAGTALTTAAFPASFAPSKDDEYAFGETGVESKSYRIVETTSEPETFTKRIRCVEYVEDVYSDDFGTLGTESPSALPLPTAPVVPAGVSNLVVTEETSRGPDGSTRTVARVEFSHLPESYASVGGTEIYLSIGDESGGIANAEHKAHLDARSTAVSIDHPFQRSQRYTVWVIPTTRDGASAYHAFASWSPFTPKGLAPVVAAPTISASINGDSVVYEVEDVDGELDHGAVIELRRGGWILGQPVAVIPAQARTSGALPAWAGSAANTLGVGTPPIYARVKLRTGQYSETALLEFEPEITGEGNALEYSEEEVGW